MKITLNKKVLFLTKKDQLKLKKPYILIVLMLLCLSGVAQQGKSFSKQKTPNKQLKVKQQLLYAETLYHDSLETALQIIEDNLLIALNKDYKPEQILAYRILGDFNADLGNVNLAYANYKKAIAVDENHKQNPQLYDTYYAYGELAFKQKNYDLALQMLGNALSISTKQKQFIKELDTRLLIGDVRIGNQQLNEAKSQFEKSLKMSKNLKLNMQLVKSQIGLGQVAQKQKNYTKAEVYYIDGQTTAEKHQLDALANQCYDLLTNLYFEINNPDEGIQIQQQAFNYNVDRGNTNMAILNSNNISQNYVEQGKTQEALEILNQTTPQVKNETNTEAKRDFIKTLSDIYAEQGLTNESKALFEEYNQLLDSFKLENEKQKAIQAKKTKSLINTENKMLLLEKDRQLNEKMIEVLKKEEKLNKETIQKQTTITYILLGGLLIIGGLAFALYRNSRQKQKANNLLVLKSLRTQMNPHFIFNSLNSVNSFIAKKDERSANKYLAEFSKLMREVLECSQQDFIPLAKEIEILERYINLEHFRFNSHFDYEFKVDKSIQLDDYQIPPMLIQPFIENAIWHGLRYKSNKGQLNVIFTQKSDHVEIQITDNGIGRKNSVEQKTINQKQMKSTGIKNVENRLDIIKKVFEKHLEISINDLDSNTNVGTKVTLKLF